MEMPLDMASDAGEGSKQEISVLLQQQISDLQQQISQLKSSEQTDTKRSQSVDTCSANIARLSDNIKDASSYLPAYDQRTYSIAIKDLNESLEGFRSSLAPKRKFAFKSKPNPVSSTARLDTKSPTEVASTVPITQHSDPNSGPTNGTHLEPDQVPIPPSTINVLERQSEWYKVSVADVPASDQTSASVTNVEACIIDLSTRSTESVSLAKVHIAEARNSLMICGHVSGSTFLTDCKGSIIVADCGQMRLHKCKDCFVYLRCSSNPVIEGCEGIRFAPLPAMFLTANHAQKQRANLWDQVEDFMWLRREPSPHWRTLTSKETIPEEIWQQVMHKQQGIEILDALLERSRI